MPYTAEVSKVVRALLVEDENRNPFLLLVDDRDEHQRENCRVLSRNPRTGEIFDRYEWHDNYAIPMKPVEFGHTDFIADVEGFLMVHIDLISVGSLNHYVLMEAAHVPWTSTWIDELENNGGSVPPGSELCDLCPHLDDMTQSAILYPIIREIEETWGTSIDQVFGLMELRSDEKKIRALSSLLMSCMGHGLCITDDFQEEFSRAEKALGKTLDTSPADLVGENPWMNVAYLDRVIAECLERYGEPEPA